MVRAQVSDKRLIGETDRRMCCDEGRVPPSPGRGMGVGGTAKPEQMSAVRREGR